ncbi:hypothetical protein GGP41_009012, partial [Bipolaris sorokiniana]
LRSTSSTYRQILGVALYLELARALDKRLARARLVSDVSARRQPASLVALRDSVPATKAALLYVVFLSTLLPTSTLLSIVKTTSHKGKISLTIAFYYNNLK